MKPIPQTFSRIILAGLLCASAGFSLAQGGPGMQGGHHGGMGRHDPAEMQTRMQAHMERRLAELKAKLKITPTQEAAWTSFTTALKPSPRPDMAALRAELDKLPTPERLDRMRALRTQHMAEMNTRMDQRADATKTFYAVLSTEQKKLFDDEFKRAAGRRGGHPMGGMMMGDMDAMGDMHPPGGPGEPRPGAHDKHRAAS